MSWEDSEKDLEAYQATLDAQAAAGTDRRVAEGRARSKAIRAFRDANPEAAAAHAASSSPAAAAVAPGQRGCDTKAIRPPGCSTRPISRSRATGSVQNPRC